MKASDLLDARVDGPDGRPAGTVLDLRTRVEPDGALVLDGLIVGRTRMRLFGYERREEEGPVLLDRLEAFVHRHTKFASMDRVEFDSPGRVRLLVSWDELPHITEI